MKLSELIEEGAKTILPVRDNWVMRNQEGQICGCPMGMAFYASHPNKEVIPDEIYFCSSVSVLVREGLTRNAGIDIWEEERINPVTGKKSYLGRIVPILYDIECWTIEQIIEWLRSEGL